MIGTPYWGDSTFLNTHKVLNHVNNMSLNENKNHDKKIADETLKESVVSLSFIESLFSKKFQKNYAIEDIRGLIYVLSKLELLFIVQDTDTGGNFLTWCKDTRFNYRDGEIFIPYYTYATTSVPYNNRQNLKYVDVDTEGFLNLRYDYEIKKHVIHKSKNVEEVDVVLDYIFVLYDKDKNEIYGLDVVNLPLINSQNFSLDELLFLYKDACYGEVDSLKTFSENSYFKLNGKGIDSVGKRKRNQYRLSLYKTKFAPLKYTDLRMYSYRELYNTDEPLKPISYWERTLLFESLLYGVFACNLEPDEHVCKPAFMQLGVTLRHVKIGNGEPSLILKHYYKNNSQLKLKSFEWR